jgi:GT2 family glycosyltransferase/glycosyltransferase involved in cell wall biosynthesis
VTTKLLVINPRIPAYRVPFFNLLSVELARHDIQLVVSGRGASPSMARPGDKTGGQLAGETPPWLYTLGGREIPRRRIASIVRKIKPDLVVVEQPLHNHETCLLLWRHAMGRYGLAIWGDVRSDSRTESPLAAALKRWLIRQGDWFFAHTLAGADHAVRNGFPPARVSILDSTIDAEQLRADLDAIDPAELGDFRHEHALTPGRTALFLGGVDEKKEIGFLLESARIAGERMPGFVLLIAGDGDLMPAVQAAQADGVPVRFLSLEDGHVKALALSAADVLAIPEQVGLVAVDALVSARPIITTDEPMSGPESDCLILESTSVVARHTNADYADALVSTLSATDRLADMQAAARDAFCWYALDRMVDSFVEGVLGWQDLRRAGLTTGTQPSRHAVDLAPRIPREKRRLAVLMTCHNRREQTLRCLGALRAQHPRDVELRVYLTDDGSTDGTATAISGFDMPVRVIVGSGELHWAAGMAMAEREAMREDPDLLLWLNDDVTLDPGGLARLLTIHEQAPDVLVVGNVRDSDTGAKTYGGRIRRGRHPQRLFDAPSAGQIQRVSAFNGNVVLIPRGVRNAVGPIDGSFAHAYADDDYGLRASNLGVTILCAAGSVGTCSSNPARPAPTSMRAAWKQLQDPKGLPWRSQVRYLRRHGGPLWPAYLAWGYGKAIMRASMRERGAGKRT